MPGSLVVYRTFLNGRLSFVLIFRLFESYGPQGLEITRDTNLDEKSTIRKRHGSWTSQELWSIGHDTGYPRGQPSEMHRGYIYVKPGRCFKIVFVPRLLVYEL